MVVAFRVDASVRIGTGHVSRCLNLADELTARGASCHFVHRLLPGHMAEAIWARGFPVHAIQAPPVVPEEIPDADYRKWTGVSEAQDAQECVGILRQIGARQVVVDHYGLGADWHVAVRTVVEQVVVIDDLANRSLDCDVLIDQNLVDGGASRYDGLVPDHCRRLCGPEFALISREYALARQRPRRVREKVERVFVFYGGSDVDDHTGLALRVLSRPEFRYLEVDVVVGSNYGHLRSLEAAAMTRGAVHVHRSLPSLLPLMLKADLALGAGGVTTWERCCLGLPSIVTAVAENQQAGCADTAAAGAILCLGRGVSLLGQAAPLEGELTKALTAVVSSVAEVEAMSDAAARLVDGWGAARVAEVMVPSPLAELVLRRARWSDAGLYWHWVNDPVVRASTHDPRPIEWDTHRAWFEGRILDSSSVLWVLESRTCVPLGQFRVDEKGGEALIAYSVDRNFRGRGLGRHLVSLGVHAWVALHGDSPQPPLIAEVVAGNEASLRVFRGAEVFEEIGIREGRQGGHAFALRPPGDRPAHGEVIA